MVSYLQKMASGHLAKNANGHLVNNCDNYVVFTQCTAACPDDPPTSDCGGGDTITSTPALIWGWSASLIGSVAKVDGKCYTVEWGTDGTPAVAVTIQSTYDCCAECCTDEPNYLLTQCDISCPNTDCDGEEDSIIIAATSVLKAASCLDSDDPVVKLNGKCWHVSETCDDTTSSGSPTGPYDGCEACCDDCYAVGGCEFSPDSTITFDWRQWSCNYENDDCSGEITALQSPRRHKATALPRVGCSWSGTVSGSDGYYNAEWDDYQPDCDEPPWDFQYNMTYKVTYTAAGEWVVYVQSGNQWTEMWRHTGTCTGASESYEEECNGLGRQTRREYTLTVHNNDCGAAGP